MSNSDHHEQSELENFYTISTPAMYVIRNANARMNRINLNIAKQGARDQVEREIEMLKNSLIELMPTDRKAIAINKRIDYLLSSKCQDYLDAKC